MSESSLEAASLSFFSQKSITFPLMVDLNLDWVGGLVRMVRGLSREYWEQVCFISVNQERETLNLGLLRIEIPCL